MCGRYEFSLGVAPLLDRVAAQEEDWQPGEVRPGMDAPVLIVEKLVCRCRTGDLCARHGE